MRQRQEYQEFEVILEHTAISRPAWATRDLISKKPPKDKKMKEKKEKRGRKERKRKRKSELEVTETLPKVPSQKSCRWTGPVGCSGRTPGEYGALWQTTPSQPGLGASSAGEATILGKTGTGERFRHPWVIAASSLRLLAQAVQFVLTTRSPSRLCMWPAIKSVLLTEILTTHREGLLREASPMLIPAMC